ncbi:glycosyltransferase [Falsirhodobacter algicola]|uniref:Glycosyltransferase n=1 Tax=Falsirhodobacter algicola TaxID=2692330 RepID=A0A8J8SL28_9RHOB|nr:glycosyltransferase [Falsirhodobacter algicola]QUS36087.1 glycosyltransferase [Falsirhodobacter algicola]
MTALAALVVTFNRRAQLERTVARLLEGPLDRLVVVDNGSEDGSRDWLAAHPDPRLTVILPPENGGGARGFEIGMRETVARFDPDWIVLMDDDARPEPGALAHFAALDHGADVVAGAVRYPSGAICDMNRPWINPFWQAGTFLRTAMGGGREAFHLGPDAYEGPHLRDIHGASFVGLFLSRKAIRDGGYPDGRFFIYGDDVHYTLGLTARGLRSVFAPGLRFEHDCATLGADRIFRPLWKTYYHHRNLWHVYRRAAGPVFFGGVMALMLPKWLMKGRTLGPEERRIYRALIRLAIRDAARGKMDRPHAEIMARARHIA